MSVIPFNPNRARGTGRAGGSAGRVAGPCAREGAHRDDDAGADAARPDRADVLERALIAALRENAANWARAEQADRQLRAKSSAAELLAD